MEQLAVCTHCLSNPKSVLIVVSYCFSDHFSYLWKMALLQWKHICSLCSSSVIAGDVKFYLQISQAFYIEELSFHCKAGELVFLPGHLFSGRKKEPMEYIKSKQTTK